MIFRDLNDRDRLREILIQKTKICFIWGVLRLRGPRQRYLQAALMGGWYSLVRFSWKYLLENYA